MNAAVLVAAIMGERKRCQRIVLEFADAAIGRGEMGTHQTLQILAAEMMEGAVVSEFTNPPLESAHAQEEEGESQVSLAHSEDAEEQDALRLLGEARRRKAFRDGPG